MSVVKISEKTTRFWLMAALIVMTAMALRWWRLEAIETKIFDEVHYIPAAEVLVGLREHPGMGAWSFHPLIGKAPAPNFEHPLLGKFMIGWGMLLFSPQAYGARFFPALSGCLSLLLMGWLSLRLFGPSPFALLAMLLTGFDSLHMIHSRLAMLDIFLMTAMTGLLLSSWRLISDMNSRNWRIAAAFFIAAGLSIKWVFAFGVLGFSWCILFLGRGDWRLRLRTWIIVGLMALGLYQLWFFYYAFHGFSYLEWLEFHVAANVATTGKLAHHPYGASALSMLLNSRNVWYHFQQTGGATIGLVGLVNPLLMFSTLPALAVLLVHYARTRCLQDIYICGWFACSYLPFFLVLRERQGFLYYMLLPLPIMILAVARMLEIFGTQGGRKALVPLYAFTFLCVAGFYLPVVLALPMSREFYLCLIKFTGI